MRASRVAGLCALLVLAWASSVTAQPKIANIVSDVRNTKHNLSSVGPADRDVFAQDETQVCVFCHTPHGAEAIPGAPLWNRKLSGEQYTTYLSSSIDAELVNNQLEQPAGSSKLCLSCHDGTLAIGAVNVLGGVYKTTPPTQPNINMIGIDTSTQGMPAGDFGVTTGFTRNLGVNLTNDHPISLTYDDGLAARDGELRVPDPNDQTIFSGSDLIVGIRNHRLGIKPLLPLERTGQANNGQIQCGTCHDPHVLNTEDPLGRGKFLRAHRLQQGAPGGGLFNKDSDTICLACHDKDLNGSGWFLSAHAHPQVANELYENNAATLREFPASTAVWQAACLNCHDTHTVQGARRLLREGVEGAGVPKQGGASAIEETCYQCHGNVNNVLSSTTEVPNVRTDFESTVRMPITNADQRGGIDGTEQHDIGAGLPPGFNEFGADCRTTVNNRCGADFLEARDNLGAGGSTNLANRHVECTDCHNPHRVTKKRLFSDPATTPDAAGTHAHGAGHTNLASGVLRGSSGVEPNYGSVTSFHELPAGYTAKRGVGTSNAATAAHVTREYQICLKCHSDYAYDDDNNYPTSVQRPDLGDSGGGTGLGTNDLQTYTNQAKEFNAPVTHQGEGTASDPGAGAGFLTNNHRSWHPVIAETGRTLAERGGASATGWETPWAGDVGTQEMYCSDCHGSNVPGAASVVPPGGENGNPWGPHGSTNNFILKGTWNAQTGTGQQATGLCFKCHDYTTYATRGRIRTGFWLTDVSEDGHSFHADRIGNMRCTWCHIAVPHGWKNKALLVNLNDVSLEAGESAAGVQLRNNTTAGFTRGPYYLNAMLKVVNFQQSGQWTAASCGSAGPPGNGQTGRDWMRDSSENCANPP